MPKWTKFPLEPLRVDILLFEQFSNLCLANTLEPFRAVNTLAGHKVYQWIFHTLDGNPVVSSSGLPVIPDQAFGPDQNGDILFVISSYDHQNLDTAIVRKALRAASYRTPLIAGLDTGAWLLAAAGQLENRRATIHWEVLESFAETFLSVEAVRRRFVIDGNRITCSGAMAAFDLALHFIRGHQGEAMRLDVASMFLHAPTTETSPATQQQPKSRVISRAVMLMQENVEHPLKIGRIASQLGCSHKYLERLFNAEYGAPPGTVYRHIRLMSARRLVENTDLPVLEIALRCGYENASAMTRAFSGKFGSSPRDMRKLDARHNDSLDYG